MRRLNDRARWEESASEARNVKSGRQESRPCRGVRSGRETAVTSASGKARGFTLIELLVVIAIIAILAAILFPVFAQAREKARQATCLSNLKQMSLGMRMYVEDYDELYPPHRLGPNCCYPKAYTWKAAIFPYLKNLDFERCPSNAFNRIPAQGEINWVERGEPFPRSYCINSAGLNENVYNARSDASIDRPSEVIMICECRYGYPNVNPSGDQQFRVPRRPCESDPSDPDRADARLAAHHVDDQRSRAAARPLGRRAACAPGIPVRRAGKGSFAAPRGGRRSIA